jgi:hypothetical protein
LHPSVSLARAPNRIGVARHGTVTDATRFQSSAVAYARTSLDDACRDLDDEVRSLSEIDGETVMANPGLVALLLRVVTARRSLADAERPTNARLPASLR